MSQNQGQDAGYKGDLADRIIDALEEGREGAVREAVEDFLSGHGAARERQGTLRVLAEALDPPVEVVRPGFVSRVMAEIRGDARVQHHGAYDRLPPLWQIAGAAALFVALTAVVFAAGPTADQAWHQRALTGFLDQALVFLGGLSAGIRGLWDAVIPGKGLPVLIGCAVLATVLNIGFVVGGLRRKTVE